MSAARRWRRPAATASVVASCAALAALTPGASVAASARNCATKSFAIEVTAANGMSPAKFRVTVRQISATGLSCKAAYAFLAKFYSSTSGTPERYKCTVGHFKVPVGKVPEVCTKPGRKIQFAGQGG